MFAEQSKHYCNCGKRCSRCSRWSGLAEWELGDGMTSGLGSDHTSDMSPVHYCVPKLMAIPPLHHSFPILAT